jgi:hypothetical protein
MEVAWNNWAMFRFGQLLGCEFVEESQERAAAIGRLFSSEDRRLTLREQEAIAALICAGIECADQKGEKDYDYTLEDCFALTELLPKVLEAFIDAQPKAQGEAAGK